jgi:hypothetical protein
VQTIACFFKLGLSIYICLQAYKFSQLVVLNILHIFTEFDIHSHFVILCLCPKRRRKAKAVKLEIPPYLCETEKFKMWESVQF